MAFPHRLLKKLPGNFTEETQTQQTESATAQTLEVKSKIGINDLYQLLKHHHASLAEHDCKINAITGFDSPSPLSV
jgi:hypothetical protein